MAQQGEPMDIDSEFDNKENSLHHNNVLPFTEKGYEELDVSELNMKLRYSITPASSPMSKSFTANCLDNKNQESGDDSHNITINENTNLTRSLNSTINKNDNVVKSLKALPLQPRPTEQFVDNDRSTSVLRALDSTISPDNANVTITVSGPSDIDEISIPSSPSSAVQTPEATTPTKEIPKNDGGSPIMRGIKSVLNMFRSSQSPIPPSDSEDTVKPEILSPDVLPVTEDAKSQMMLASTPLSAHRKKETSPTKRSSPHKDSIVFNEDLEKELQWKDETTILFSQERIPIHKLFFQQVDKKSTNKDVVLTERELQDDLNSTLEYMDISYNDSIRDRTMTDLQVMGNKSDFSIAGESDGEFVDCETTFIKNESLLVEDNNKTPVNDQTHDLELAKGMEDKNENISSSSASRLKQIILNTTQDILDATLSITPEDLIPEALENVKEMSGSAFTTDITEPKITSNTTELEKVNKTVDIIQSGENQEQSLYSQDNSVHSQSVISPFVNLELKEENNVNVSVACESVSQLILDQTLDITSSLTSVKQKEDSNVGKTEHIIPAETAMEENQPILTDNLCSTLTNEANTLLETEAIEEQEVKLPTDHSHLKPESILDIENSKIILTGNNDHITELNSDIAKISAEISISETLVEHSQPLPIFSDKFKKTHIKEASMTELPVDIPLPDEDDLEKELIVPDDATTEALIASNSQPLDLVDDIKILETSEIKHIGEGGEKLAGNINNDEIILPEALPPIYTNYEGGDNIQTMILNQDSIKSLENIEHAVVKNEKPLISEEPHILTVGVLKSEIEPLLNNVNKDNDNKINQVPYVFEQMNKTETVTESLNETVVASFEQNAIPSHDVVAMDINESVMGLKPLPDIINQTIIPNVESFEPTINIPEPVAQEEPSPVSNVTNEVANSETMKNVVPELLSDSNTSGIVETANESATNVIEDVMYITSHDTEINEQVTDAIESYTPKDIPIVTEKVMCQPNNDDILPIEDVMVENDKKLLDTDIIPVNKVINILTIEDVKAENEQKLLDTDVAPVNKDDGIKTLDEEIVLSENNSPFVSVIAEHISEIKPDENTEVRNVDNQTGTAGRVVYTPPTSPPIASKGYNFNFDEMDDPFATKTKIRVSPTRDTPTKAVELKASSKSVEKPIGKREIINRRKSQPERSRPVASKRKFSSTFSGTVTEKPHENFAGGDIKLESPANVALDPSNVTIDEDKIIHEAKIVHEKTLNVTKEVLGSETNDKDKIELPIEKPKVEVIESVKSATDLSKEIKTTSSSEQSAYYSAGTSSSESIYSKNVFNLPEIDDVNFNPFATKSKMRQSPISSLDIENPFATKSKIRTSPESSMISPPNDDNVLVQDITKPQDKIETELMEKDASGDFSNTTTISRSTDDKNASIREVNTEDEDTVEGPFLEVEDLNADDKMLDFDGNKMDMMNFNDLPAQGNEDKDTGELFIDAEAFEFLLNQNKSHTVVDSGKESLFLKFDPLFAKRMSTVTSDGVVAALNKIQKRQSTPTKASKPPQKEFISPIAGPSNLNVTQDMDMNVSEEFNEDLNVTVSKPMMVVPPAVNPVTPRNKSLTPNRSNRRSITFTSPAMAVIDRLLSLSGNNSLVHDTTVQQQHVSREQNEADLALVQLRELLAEKEISVYSLRSESKELKDRLTTLESHLKNLEAESQERLKNIKDLNNRLAEKTKINKSMAAVVEEYERTIASLISETAQDKKRHAEERIKLINERDEQTAHLASMEVSFSDLHSKYEKSKQIILNCKANEDTYKKSIKEFEENLTKMQTNYELLKQHATSKLNHANQELEKMNRTHEAEVLKLNAMIKRKDLHITSLEESLAQKTKANEELTAICDELINKVG